METNGFRAPIRARVGTLLGIERKTPPQIALCRPFARTPWQSLLKDPAPGSFLKARAILAPARASMKKGDGGEPAAERCGA